MADRAGNIAPESRTQGVILSETARRPSCGRRRLFEERQTDGTAAERHGKQLPQTCRPGFRGYKAVVRTERQRKEVRRRATGYRRRTTNGKRWTMDGATGDGQQAARGWTAMDGDGRRAEEVRNGGRKTRRNTDAGGRTDKAGELPAERATGRGSYGQRELRAGKRKT